MLGAPKHDEPLTTGEARAAWRVSLHRRWTEHAVLAEEIGERAYLHWALEEPYPLAA